MPRCHFFEFSVWTPWPSVCFKFTASIILRKSKFGNRFERPPLFHVIERTSGRVTIHPTLTMLPSGGKGIIKMLIKRRQNSKWASADRQKRRRKNRKHSKERKFPSTRAFVKKVQFIPSNVPCHPTFQVEHNPGRNSWSKSGSKIEKVTRRKKVSK